jgi:PAS domain S-box-containing protein
MKSWSPRVLGLALLTGLLFWVVDALLDFLVFYPGEGSFPDLLLFDVPPHELYVRFLILTFFLVSGALISRSVREREAVQDRLQEQRDRARQFLETAEVMLVALDAEGRIEMLNRRGCEILGCRGRGEACELLGENWFERCLPEEIRDEVRKIHGRVMAGDLETTEAVEERIVTRQGEERVIAWRNAIRYDREGRAHGTLSSGMDITEERRREEAKRKTEQLLDETGEMARVGGWEVDLETDRVQWTRVTRLLHEVPEGYEPAVEEALDFFPPEDRRRLSNALNRARHEGEPYDLELDFVTAKGNRRRVRAIAKPEMEDGTCIRLRGTFQDVTDRWKMEEALRASERKYRTVFETTGTATGVLEEDTRISLVNTEMEELIGLPRKEIEGKRSWTEFVAPEDLEWMREQHELRREHPDAAMKRYDFVFVTADGERKNVTLAVDVIPGTSRSVASILDVTARVEAQKALQEALEWQRNIVEGSRDAIFVSDRDARFVLVNSAAVELTGYTRAELLEMRIPDLHAELDREAYRRYHARILAGEEALTEAPVLRSDGSKIDVEFNNRRVEVGGRVYMHTVARDVTARKRTEAELKASERRYRSLVEGLQEGIWVIDENAVTTFVNPAMAEMLGYEAEEMVGRPLTDFVFPEDRGDVEEHLARRRDDIAEVHDFNFRRKDGTGIWASVSGTAVFDEEGRYRGAKAGVMDITAQVEAQRRLEASRTRLRALAARLERVREEERTSLARELHDQLGQILTSLRMDLSFLPEEAGADVRSLEAPLQEALGVVDQAIALTQNLSARLRPPVLDVLGLDAAIEWHTERVEPSSGLEWELELEKGEARLDREVAGAVFRVFQEAATNVIRHARASTVGVRLTYPDGDLLLEVLDDGVGIRDEDLRAVDSLGLAGMSERALALGGELAVRGRPGDGTAVILRVPLPDEGLEPAEGT